ncbi:MAG: DUF5667 domain-containing protein, partial [Patescibacteria group bacterium]
SGVRVGPVIPVRIDQAFAVGSSFVFDSDTGLASQVATVDYMLERPLAGAVKLRIIVDPWEYYQEGSAGETNNIADIDRPVPDYLIDSVEFNGAVLKFAIHNQGQGVPAYRRVSNVFYTDVVLRLQWLGSGSENLLSTYSSPGDYGNVAIGTPLAINSDAAGYTAMRNFLIAPPNGATRLRIIIDPNNAQVEVDEGNNVMEITLITPQTSGEDLVEADEEEVVQEIEQDLTAEEEIPSPPAPTSQPSEETLPAPTSAPTPALAKKFKPKILPGSPFYFLKTTWRETKAAFTFNSQKDAELRLRYANEKVLEANMLIDQGKTDRAVNHLRSYTRDIEKVNQFTARLEKKDKAAAQKIADRATTHQLK